ncbi:MAG: cytidylate kinase-like family protein [Lachnospiraceae bacterium]|nr:cytidylate kinase-like family protein [Lachnospiraceae bacterium]
MKNYIITIARGFGSGGKYIGQKVGELLDIPCYEREILTMASEKSGINEAVFAEIDEKLRGSRIRNALRAMPCERTIYPQDKEFVSDNNLFQIQSEIIKALADEESCVIIGKCADYVLQNRPNVLSIYVDAPREYCVYHIMQKMSVSEKEANKLIEKTDKYRADYYRYYTKGGNWVNPTNYHLFLNSEKLGRNNCADIIANIIREKYL